MNRELKDSGLGELLQINTITGDLELGSFLGKKVKYSKAMINTAGFKKKYGSLAVDAIYEIREVQKNWKGEDCLRGYNIGTGDTFGRCLCATEIELIN